MKIVGLITEYNPFHNGHLYHIKESLRVTGADAAVVVMSGDYVQRGTPAIMPKTSSFNPSKFILINGRMASYVPVFDQ